MKLNDSAGYENHTMNLNTDAVGVSEAFSNIINPENPLFDENRISSKV